MKSNRMYRLRRALLAALYEYDSYQDLDTVLCNPAVICVNPSPEEARTEWKNLREWGLTDALAGYGGSVRQAVGVCAKGDGRDRESSAR